MDATDLLKEMQEAVNADDLSNLVAKNFTATSLTQIKLTFLNRKSVSADNLSKLLLDLKSVVADLVTHPKIANLNEIAIKRYDQFIDNLFHEMTAGIYLPYLTGKKDKVTLCFDMQISSNDYKPVVVFIIGLDSGKERITRIELARFILTSTIIL